MDNEKRAEIKQCLDHIVGLALTEVRKPEFDIDFLFSDEIHVIVSINTDFSYSLGPEGRAYQFDPNSCFSSERHHLGFFTCVGKRVVASKLENGVIRISFENGSAVEIDLSGKSFEPVIFTGYKDKELLFLVPV